MNSYYDFIFFNTKLGRPTKTSGNFENPKNSSKYLQHMKIEGLKGLHKTF